MLSVMLRKSTITAQKMIPVMLRKNTITAQKLLAWPLPKCWASSLISVSDSGSSSGPQHVTQTSLTRPPTECPRDSRNKYSPGTLAFMRTGLFGRISSHAMAFTARNQYFHSSVMRLKKRVQPEPPPRELDLLRYDMKDLWKSPKPALWLGFAGLIPFVAPPLFMGVTECYSPEFAYTQLAYAVSIVSFLGGARWGYALPESSPAKPDWINLSNSVVPSLLAWITTLMADSIVTAMTMVIMALGISLHYDLSLLPTYPSWFKALRAVLTTVAFFSLVGTLIAYGMYPEKIFFSE